MTLPPIDYEGKDARAIALLAARLCQLPDAKTVRRFEKAVFPTLRNSLLRGERIYLGGKPVGMYDDNTTPRWALLWSHGIRGGNKTLEGWHIAHVWNNCNNLDCYTRLENLLLVPAAYAGLTDGEGPLAPYLRYHALEEYRWCPGSAIPEPKKPRDYDAFRNECQYLDAAIDDARHLVLSRLQKSRSGRATVLREFIGDISYWDHLPSGKA